MKNGSHLHRIADASRRTMPPAKPAKPPLTIDAGAIHDALRLSTPPADLLAMSERLGVSEYSLDCIGAAWHAEKLAWAFPMRDAAGLVVGIRLRADDGRKWAVTGSRAGLFYDPFMDVPEDRVLYVAEGPTDTAAAITLGLPCIGRHACRGQVAAVAALARRMGFRRAVIISDNDAAKSDGSYPGQEGAEELALALPLPTKVITPPGKDLRAWLQAGGNVAVFRVLERQCIWRFPICQTVL